MYQEKKFADMSCFGVQDVVLSEREMMLIRATAYYTASAMLGIDNAGSTENAASFIHTHLENSTLQDNNNSSSCTPSTLSVKEVSEALNLSLTKTYALVRQKDFPAIRLGKNIRIPEKEFSEWIRKNSAPSRKGEE